MRAHLVALVALALSACATDDDGPFPADPHAASAACERFAADRATDGAYQGLDVATQRRQHDTVYRECLYWRTRS